MRVQCVCVCASSRSWGGVSRGQEGGLEFTEDRFLLRSAWVALESFRSSFVQLVGQAPCWIQTRLRFEDWHQLSPADLWRALGVHCGNAEKLVDMELRWSPAVGILLVSARSQLCGSAAADVRELLKSAWCFDSFSRSRWLGIGRICEVHCDCDFTWHWRRWCGLCERHLVRASVTLLASGNPVFK